MAKRAELIETLAEVDDEIADAWLEEREISGVEIAVSSSRISSSCFLLIPPSLSTQSVAPPSPSSSPPSSSAPLSPISRFNPYSTASASTSLLPKKSPPSPSLSFPPRTLLRPSLQPPTLPSSAWRLSSRRAGTDSSRTCACTRVFSRKAARSRTCGRGRRSRFLVLYACTRTKWRTWTALERERFARCLESSARAEIRSVTCLEEEGTRWCVVLVLARWSDVEGASTSCADVDVRARARHLARHSTKGTGDSQLLACAQPIPEGGPHIPRTR